MIKVVIIDDEINARQIIYSLLETRFSHMEIIGEADSVSSGLKLLQELKPDLVLLDVRLKDGNSFEILEKLPEITFSIVFVTAYNEYALNAFKFSAIDYILKPIETDEFVDAIHKVIKYKDNRNFQLSLKNYQDSSKEIDGSVKKIILKTLEEVYQVAIKDIIRCEANGTYTSFFLENGGKIMVSKNIKHYSDLLGGFNFFRIHKSHLINMDYFASFKKKDGGLALLKNKEEIPVSFRKRELLIKYISSE